MHFRDYGDLTINLTQQTGNAGRGQEAWEPLGIHTFLEGFPVSNLYPTRSLKNGTRMTPGTGERRTLWETIANPYVFKCVDVWRLDSGMAIHGICTVSRKSCNTIAEIVQHHCGNRATPLGKSCNTIGEIVQRHWGNALFGTWANAGTSPMALRNYAFPSR